MLAVLGAMALAGASTGVDAQPAPAYDCVNTVLRDTYWGGYRYIVENGESDGKVANLAGVFARHGFLVNDAPSVGAMMVWPASLLGASAFGHVGIVAAVGENGTVLVRHENWPYGTAEHLDTFGVQPGHQFVHHRDTAAALAAIPIAAITTITTIALTDLTDDSGPPSLEGTDQSQ
jgi:surface antigen